MPEDVSGRDRQVTAQEQSINDLRQSIMSVRMKAQYGSEWQHESIKDADTADT